uniref:Uncharacterized protein n=1 Tax=Cyclophora tenuis TaxID=216820 RepID=A0A7S1D2K1_CYCTE|mmetsp:Transcript_18120/g.30891  ORF Transcript_18120/g.30891 Transcript_18120/m.30891 type:complete len:147 (+) Transcript_18120:259-699(+)
MPKLAYAPSPVHGGHQMTVEQVFDTPKIKIQPHLVADDLAAPFGVPKIAFDPLDRRKGTHLATDPFPNATQIHFECTWAYSLYAMPQSIFPQQRFNFFPFHHTYQKTADSIVRSIRQRTGKKEDEPVRLLGMQIRLGDRKTWPVID